MRPVLTRLHALLLRLLPQLSRFAVVGAVGLLVDVGGFNLLRFAGGHGPLYDAPLSAKLISSAAATVVAWLGNRYWTFRAVRRSAAHHEFGLFVAVSLVGMTVSLATLAVSHYVLGLHSALADNVSANVVGLVLATSFRFYAYRTFVFTEDRTPASAPALVETTVSRG